MVSYSSPSPQNVPRLPIQVRPSMLYFRGALALIFAAICFLTPGPSIDTFSRLAGIYFVVDGITAVLLSNKSDWRAKRYTWTMLTGLAGLGVGFWTFFARDVSPAAIDELVGLWAFFIGVMELGGMFEMRRDAAINDGTRRLVGACGAVSAVLGIIMIAQGLFNWTYLIGLLGWNALATGVASAALGSEVGRCIREGLCEPESRGRPGTTGRAAS